MTTRSGALAAAMAAALAVAACGGGGDETSGPALDVGSLAVGEELPPAMADAPARSLADRPDDQAGPQVHVVYSTSSDGPDPQLDTRGAIADSLFEVDRWLARTTGLAVRLDTFGGALDVQFVRLPRRSGDYFAAGRDRCTRSSTCWAPSMRTRRTRRHCAMSATMPAT